MIMQPLIDQILEKKEQKPKDYWEARARAPLFTKKLYEEYENGIIPEGDIIYVDIDTRDAQSRTPFNGLVCASTGVGKDRLIKNLVKAFYKQGYRILHFEPKGYEFLNARYKGTGKKLHQYDKNESLPVVGYCPYFIKEYLEKNGHPIANKVKFYSPQIEKMDYVEIWTSLGFRPKAASMVVEQINNGVHNIDRFYSTIKNAEKGSIHSGAKQSGLSNLDMLKASNFLGTTKILNLQKEWDEHKIVNVMYMSRDGAMMNCDIGLILDQIRDIGINESKKGLQYVTKKLIIFNDAFYYAGMSAKLSEEKVNLAIRNIGNCQNNFRTWGVDTLFVVQSPSTAAVYPSLIDGCTTKFVSYTENAENLRGKLPMQAFELLSNTDPSRPMLYVDEDSYTYQWIYVRGKTRWMTGFPLDCSLGHAY